MRKVAVYAGTRNVYHNMAVAAKSLLCHTQMDRVWILIEDDEVPEELSFPRDEYDMVVPWARDAVFRF